MPDFAVPYAAPAPSLLSVLHLPPWLIVKHTAEYHGKRDASLEYVNEESVTSGSLNTHHPKERREWRRQICPYGA